MTEETEELCGTKFHTRTKTDEEEVLCTLPASHNELSPSVHRNDEKRYTWRRWEDVDLDGNPVIFDTRTHRPTGEDQFGVTHVIEG